MVNEIVGKNEKKRSEALRSIYAECFPKVLAFVLKNSGSEQDALDLFQEGVLIVYNQVQGGQYKGEASISTYLYAIVKRQWYAQYNKMMRKKSLLPPQNHEEADNINTQLLDRVMSHLKSDCIEILRGFYYQRKSMAEIMNNMGLGSVQAAKNKKYRCLKYLHSIIEKEGLKYDNFIL